MIFEQEKISMLLSTIDFHFIASHFCYCCCGLPTWLHFDNVRFNIKWCINICSVTAFPKHNVTIRDSIDAKHCSNHTEQSLGFQWCRLWRMKPETGKLWTSFWKRILFDLRYAQYEHSVHTVYKNWAREYLARKNGRQKKRQ